MKQSELLALKGEFSPNYERKPLSEFVDEIRLSCEKTKLFTLIDKNLELATLKDQLLDSQNTNFLVIGVIGPQGSGKSTLMNSVAEFYKPNITRLFKTNNVERPIQEAHITREVGVLNTCDGILLIDTPPLFSASVFDEFILSDKSLKNFGWKYANSVEIESYRILMLILSICHVVLVVHDPFLDEDIFRRLEVGLMLKPVPFVFKDIQEQSKVFEFKPHVVQVFNQVDSTVFSDPTLVQELHSVLETLLESDRSINRDSLDEGSPNIVILPRIDELPVVYKNRVKELGEKLNQIDVGKFTGKDVSEENWYLYVRNIWNVILRDPKIENFINEESTFTKRENTH